MTINYHGARFLFLFLSRDKCSGCWFCFLRLIPSFNCCCCGERGSDEIGSGEGRGGGGPLHWKESETTTRIIRRTRRCNCRPVEGISISNGQVTNAAIGNQSVCRDHTVSCCYIVRAPTGPLNLFSSARFPPFHTQKI